jgi:NAD-dependent SIR2 family protein deacetylase
MGKLTAKLRCPQCETSFPVEFNRMRANVPNPCPSCGFSCGVSEDLAIRAHRLLERLEYRKRLVSHLPQSGVMSA